MRIATLGMLAVALGGCSSGRAEDQRKDFHKRLNGYFNALNQDAELSRIESKVNLASRQFLPSTGIQFNSFHFDPVGFLLMDVTCDRCRTVHPVIAYFGRPVHCSSCGSRDRSGQPSPFPLIRPGLDASEIEAQYKDKAKRMYEEFGSPGDRPREIIAIVRYLRRNWTLDERARIDLARLERSARGPHQDAANAVKPLVAPDAADAQKGRMYYADGYHRPSAAFIATAAFRYKGGSMDQLDQETVYRMMKGDAPDPARWRLGPSIAVEQVVPSWNAPRRLDTPSLRAY